MRVLIVCSLAVVASAVARSDSPVAKVITLLEDLKTQVQSEGSAEATTYDTFACWCKSSTSDKSTAIKTSQDEIDRLSAEMQENSALMATKEADLAERKVKQTELGGQLTESVNRCTTESATFEANVADVTKAISSLAGAIQVLSGSKPATGTQSLLTIRQNLNTAVNSGLALAEAMSLIDPAKSKSVQAFIQRVDPADPAYKFHSSAIITTLEDLQKEFTASKTETESEWEKSKEACSSMKKSITDEMNVNDEAMKALATDIENLKTSIAEDRVSLIQEEETLKNDQLYLKDVTTKCENRATEWDQRSGLRAGELQAIEQALTILQGKVTEMDEVNNRTLLLQRRHPKVQVAVAKDTMAIRRHVVSLMQRGSSRNLAINRKQDLAREILLKTNSPALSAIAKRIAADPFAKVKSMIQGLIERLLNEATEESTKKGFCDQEIAKAITDRDFRNATLQKLAAKNASLEAKKEELTEDISLAATNANTTAGELEEAATERAASKATNLETIVKAKDGNQAVTEAIGILKIFYKQSAKGKVDTVVMSNSVIDAENPGAGFDGPYKGQQESSKGILGLLAVIQSDFERTVKTTEASEKKAAGDFVDFDRTAKMSIASDVKSKELNEQDLDKTVDDIAETVESITSNEEMMAAAIQALEDLQPMCFDADQTFAERAEQREAEIAALKKALCYIDPSSTEEECSGEMQS